MGKKLASQGANEGTTTREGAGGEVKKNWSIYLKDIGQPFARFDNFEPALRRSTGWCGIGTCTFMKRKNCSEDEK